MLKSVWMQRIITGSKKSKSVRATFGRSVVEEVTGLKSSGASKLISLLLNSNVIEPVSGKGKGKYKFFREV